MKTTCMCCENHSFVIKDEGQSHKVLHSTQDLFGLLPVGSANYVACSFPFAHLLETPDLYSEPTHIHFITPHGCNFAFSFLTLLCLFILTLSNFFSERGKV